MHWLHKSAEVARVKLPNTSVEFPGTDHIRWPLCFDMVKLDDLRTFEFELHWWILCDVTETDLRTARVSISKIEQDGVYGETGRMSIFSQFRCSKRDERTHAPCV